MAGQTSAPNNQVVTYPTVKYVFYGLALLVFLIAVGHLYVFEGMTNLYLGLPTWVWLENLVLIVMLVIAWTAVRLRAISQEGGK